MCGIAGFVRAGSAADPEVVQAQLDLMQHRGSDSAGHFVQGRGGIGQNRLAVIDLRTGDPPILNEDRSVGVVLNGEIYNYLDLRRSLLDQGHRFATKGDTEVIAHLAEDLAGRDLASGLDGMFAFAVWDTRAERLTLGRDRFGKKPLYYWHDENNFVFASEIKALLAHPQVPRRMQPDVLDAYLTFGYVPTPHTFFQGVLSLPPGSVLEVGPGSQPRISSYWDPPHLVQGAPDRIDLSRAESASRVRELLEKAVQKRLISDVSLGAFLSGGIDSSAVVGIMARLMDSPVETFTIGFDDGDGFDERAYARAVAQTFKTAHTEFVVKPDAVQLVEKLVWHHDQPFGDSSAIPTFLLAELTRQHVTVALSGDGGDELFGGYERFVAARWVTHYRMLPGPLQRTIASALKPLPRTALKGRVGTLQRFIGGAKAELPEAYLTWLSIASEEQRAALLGRAGSVPADYRRVWDASWGGSVLDRLLTLNLQTYLLDDLLVKADRMSMAHALEVRSPFLDRELAEFSLRLGDSAKIRGITLKSILKDALSDLLPEEVLRRRKRGFGVPLDRWFRSDLQNYVKGTIGNKKARIRNHLDPVAVDRLLGEHDSGLKDHGALIWALLTLEVFLLKQEW